MPDISIPRLLSALRQRAVGTLNYIDLGRRIGLVESRWTAGMYIGYAVKST
jgi:hypothetical protein